jgi:outer membrane protein assembly factor BamB
LKGDTEAEALIAEVVQAHRAALRYEPAESDVETPRGGEDRLPSLVVTPLRSKAAGPTEDGVVLALAHGVLYALEPGGGAVRWVRRVGADTRVLPMRVPPDPVTPELVLVLSADSRTVTALVAATGELWWQQALEGREPCLGQPILIQRSLLVPTQGGRVEEIEISRGRRLGSYHLGQPLSVGGVHQPGTTLAYFPADEYCVYALDVMRRTCAAVLYTGHAAGSLRSVPLVLPESAEAIAPEGHATTGWLLLSLARGDGQTELRPYALPLRSADQPAAEPAPRLSGRAAFAPWQDTAKLAVATDIGYLSLWGLRQRGNRDPLLFPLLKDKDAYPVETGKAPMRALVVHADAENYWVLAHGKLQRLQATFKPQSGPDLVRRWPQPPLLGVPEHEAERRTSADGKNVFYLTTQLPGEPTTLASAVESEDGRLLWQRQLGCLPQGPPVALGSNVVVRDAGGLLLFDAEQSAPTSPFQNAGELLASDMEPEHEHALLGGGADLVELSWPRRASGECKVRLRHLTLMPERKLTSHTHVLKAAPLGTPALVAGQVVVPLANGILARLNLADAPVALGPNWRGDGVDDHQPGHLVALGDSDFVVTDGNRGLQRLSWPAGGDAESRARAMLPHRLLTAPALVPGPDGPSLCVADASGALTLLDGRLQVRRSWTLPGRVTAGPFVREGKIGCVVGKASLVWLDPDSDTPLWQYALPAEIVGAPPLVDGVLVVADVQGQFRALDPATGNARGPGYTLRANVAASAAPVAFGPGRLFVPLSDGTILLLPLSELLASEP